MSNVRCSSVEKTKGIVQTSNLAVQIQISDSKHFVALGKHGIYCRQPPKLKIQNGDDDDEEKDDGDDEYVNLS